MTNPRYTIGRRYCKRGGHWLGPEDIVIAKGGNRICKEHKKKTRNRPRARRYREALLNVRAIE